MLSYLLRCCIGAFLVLLLSLGSAGASLAAGPDASPGALLFEQHCAGCHINGSNIIRRGKNLKLKPRARDAIATVTAISAISREGRGVRESSPCGSELRRADDEAGAVCIKS